MIPQGAQQYQMASGRCVQDRTLGTQYSGRVNTCTKYRKEVLLISGEPADPACLAGSGLAAGIYPARQRIHLRSPASGCRVCASSVHMTMREQPTRLFPGCPRPGSSPETRASSWFLGKVRPGHRPCRKSHRGCQPSLAWKIRSFSGPSAC